MKFQKDLAGGHEAELFVAHWYEERGCKVKRVEGYFPDFDLLVTRSDTRPFTVEVKHDEKAHRTGNFWYELEAISHCKADILVYCYGKPISKLYFYNFKDLHTRLMGIEPNSRGGDKSEPGWRLPINQFKADIRDI